MHLKDLRHRLSTHGEELPSLYHLTQVASLISEACRRMGVARPTVVGGLAVEIYTSGGYSTVDIDMITEDDAGVAEVMRLLGYKKRPGVRYYERSECRALVEFPTGPLDGSRDRVVELEIEDGGTLLVIGIEDILLDRVAAYEHWDHRRPDSEDAIQAISLLVAHRASIDFEYLHQKAREKGLADALADIEARASATETEG